MTPSSMRPSRALRRGQVRLTHARPILRPPRGGLVVARSRAVVEAEQRSGMHERLIGHADVRECHAAAVPHRVDALDCAYWICTGACGGP